jgi:hypothetical protein
MRKKTPERPCAAKLGGSVVAHLQWTVAPAVLPYTLRWQSRLLRWRNGALDCRLQFNIWGPPMRVLAPPEITLIEIAPAR